jgi:hypothetical protein
MISCLKVKFIERSHWEKFRKDVIDEKGSVLKASKAF